MALAERLLNARFGDDLVDHYTYAIAGDGCLMEGISHEAIDMAGHLRLGRLIVLFDDNQISIDGSTNLSTSTDQLARFEAAGWSVRAVDGHDAEAVAAAIEEERNTDKPSLIACRTKIGYGAPTRAGTSKAHGEPLGEEEVAGARKALDWPHEAFVVPEPVLAAWRATGARGSVRRNAWEQRLNNTADDLRDQFIAGQEAHVSDIAAEALASLKATWVEEKPKLATRQSSQKTLEVLIPSIPYMLGGSADLTGSVGTKISSHEAVTRDDYAGTYVHYGVREHGMAAVMNGITLHKGFIPYGGTFLVFADYSRPSIRLAALMGIRVIHILTHDSIGLGEDGPTHQPVETLASLRAIPNVTVLRPADSVETAEAWEAALANENGPTALVLTRQGLPALRDDASDNKVARGGYVIREADGARKLTIIATGSEVSIAVEAAEALAKEGIAAAVVSMASIELFADQPDAYRAEVLGTSPRIVVEAAVRQSWDRFLRDGDEFIGMSSFGISAPGPQAYEHFGITTAAITEAGRRLAK
jgi:transketolase